MAFHIVECTCYEIGSDARKPDLLHANNTGADETVYPIRISEILSWNIKPYLTYAILPRTLSHVIIENCIKSYSQTSGSLF